MPYQTFHSFFPDLAERETRTLILPEPRGGLPADAYTMLEMYCNEPGCDCRRVFFMVVGERHREPLATVAYGWESREYYARWMGSDAPEDIEELQGPILNLASPQSKYAPALLRLIENVLLATPAYIERLKRHYRMFRDAVDQQPPPASAPFPTDRGCGGRRIPSASAPVIDRRLDAAERKRVLAAKMRELYERRSQKKRAR